MSADCIEAAHLLWVAFPNPGGVVAHVINRNHHRAGLGATWMVLPPLRTMKYMAIFVTVLYNHYHVAITM